MAATKTATARVHPAKHHPDWKSLQDLLRYLRAVGRHEPDGADAMREAAHMHSRAIIASSNLPLGLNKRWAARKQKRALLKVANALELVSHATGTAAATTLGTFAQGASSGGGFDPTK